MEGNLVLTDLKQHNLSVSFTDKEWNKLDQYLAETGLKKGAFIRKIIMAYLDSQEQEERGQI